MKLKERFFNWLSKEDDGLGFIIPLTKLMIIAIIGWLSIELYKSLEEE